MPLGLIIFLQQEFPGKNKSLIINKKWVVLNRTTHFFFHLTLSVSMKTDKSLLPETCQRL